MTWPRPNARVPRRATSEAGGPAGFTLLEVLLALALFSMAVVVLVASYLNIVEGLAAVRADREFEQEVRWVREQVLLQAELEELAKGGTITTPGDAKLSWESTVLPAPVADLFTVELHVTMEREKDRRREHAERLTVLRPQWSEPTERGKLLEEARSRIEEDRRARGVVAEKRT